MIYTITTNPSLDYYLSIENLKEGEVNRSKEERFDAAGKGVNVSKYLNLLGIPSVALGFLGGYNKNLYLDILSNYLQIQPQFTSIKENTRINVKILDEVETSINAKGPNISDEEYNKFSKRLYNIYENDYVALSGNVQEELVDRIVEDIKQLILEDVNVVLETDQAVIDKLVDSKPFMIKFSRTSGVFDENEIIEIGKNYVERGVKYFMYSAYNKPAYLIEKGCYYKCDISKLTPISLAGTSDSMIAGFLWACLKAANSIEAFTYASAVTASINATNHNEFITSINNFTKTLKIERFEY